MFTKIALAIALVTTIPVATLPAQAGAPVIRTIWGIRYEIPAGWEWTEFDGNTVTIQHLGTKSGAKGQETSPNRFSLGGRKTPDDSVFGEGWDRLDRDQRRTFTNGATARWRAGPRPSWGHYVFAGEAKIGSKVLSVSILDTLPAKFDLRLVEAAFLRVVETLTDVRESATIYHPNATIAADEPNKKSWYGRLDGARISFRCWSNGRSGNTWIDTYPSSVVFADTGTALADITGHFEKNDRLKIGAVQRTDVSGGEMLWTEQPGTSRPFLGAVKRDGRFFFVSAYIDTSDPLACTERDVRKDFIAVGKGVRSWDGR